MYKMHKIYEIYEMFEMHEMYKIYEICEMYKMYEMYEMYEEGMRKYETDGRYPSHTLSQPVSPLIPSLSFDTLNPSKLCHVSISSFALQANTACDAYGRLVISYQQYDEDNLGQRLPVIGNMSTMTT